MNEGEVNEDEVSGVEVNWAEVNDGEVNDVLTNAEGGENDVGLICAKSEDDNNDMSFNCDSALYVAFYDSDDGSGSDGLME